MTYHRKSGSMKETLEKMKECIPYYSRITENHGIGADLAMEAETYLMKGDSTKCEIAYHQAIDTSLRHKQYSITIVAEFTKCRLNLLNGESDIFSNLDKLYLPIKDNQQYLLLSTLDMCKAWLYAILDKEDKAAEWLLFDDISSSVLGPALAVLEIIRNELLLKRASFGQVIARYLKLHELNEGFIIFYVISI